MRSELLTLQEVASILRISKSTVYRHISSLNLPAMKVGKKWRFKLDQVENWMTQQNPNFPKFINHLNN